MIKYLRELDDTTHANSCYIRFIYLCYFVKSFFGIPFFLRGCILYREIQSTDYGGISERGHNCEKELNTSTWSRCICLFRPLVLTFNSLFGYLWNSMRYI